MEYDIKQPWGNSLIQHGKSNDRIYLMKLDPEDAESIIVYLDDLAVKNGYGKIFAKVPARFRNLFMEKGYVREASVPGFYGGNEDALFLGKFFSEARKTDDDRVRIEEVIIKATEKKSCPGSDARDRTPLSPRTEKITFRKAIESDVPEICRVYGKVFSSYPFPIHENRYIFETMKSHVEYYVACEGDRIIGVSSSEKDPEHKNTEMTDFATLPEYRGRGIAMRLLDIMGTEMTKKGMITAYTIARALSPGMNITFARNGYDLAGTLIKNTCICGAIESMNIWYKKL